MAVGCTPQDHAAAARFATGAGQLLARLRGRLDHLTVTARGKEGDRRSHGFLVDAIGHSYPDDAILSEEALGGTARSGRRRVWIVDPLDGTREYGQVGRQDWAVHVALVVDGQPVAGAVALPARGLTLCSHAPLPPPPAPRPAIPRLVVSRSRPPGWATVVAAQLGATLVPMGSAGAKTAAVVLGEAEIYIHAGGQYEWDSAAPVAVARAAGLHASRIDGASLVFNRPDPWLPDLLVCRRELAAGVLEVLQGLA